MKTWMESLNELAAGMLFNGGYVAAARQRGNGQPAECARPVVDAGEQGVARTDEARRRPPRPSSRLATD